MSTTTKRKLTIKHTDYGSSIIDMPNELSGLTREQAATAWAYFTGAISSAGQSLGSVRKVIGTAQVIQIMVDAANYARKEGGK